MMKYKNISGKQEDRNREWTRMDAKLGECGLLGALTALPRNRISEYSRLFEFIRGFMRNSLISKPGLMQVIDFHDFSGYFSWFAVTLHSLVFLNRLTQVVDFHDNFR
jgi:hypothetical protein